MKKLLAVMALIALIAMFSPAAFATHGVNGKVTPKSIGAGALSLLVWPGIGQAVNNQNNEKVLIHALLGLTGIFRFWSAYDGLVDRNGGVWDNRI